MPMKAHGKTGLRAALLGSALLLAAACAGGRTRREIAAEYFNLGNAFFELRKFDRALDFYERALAYSSSFPEGGYNLARVYILQDRFGDAVEILKGLLDRDRDNLVVLQTLAYALGKAGRVEEAVDAYGEVLARSEGNIAALYNLSLLLEFQGRSREAYELLSRAVRLSPEDPDLLRRMGRLEARHGSRRAAIEYLKAYREKGGADGETDLFLVRLLEEEGLYSDALQVAESLAQTRKDDPEALFERAYLLLAKAEEKAPGLEALARAAEKGYADKKRVSALLLEVPEAFLQDVRAAVIEKGLLSPEEAEEVLAAPFGDP